MLSVKPSGIKYRFWVFGMTRPGIEPLSSGPQENSLLVRPNEKKNPETLLQLKNKVEISLKLNNWNTAVTKTKNETYL